MARLNEDTKHSRYVIRIICEGEKTEPLFFTSLCDRLIDGVYHIGDCDIKTIPQPDVSQEEPISANRGAYKSQKRKVKGKKTKPQVVIEGVPPLKWVKFARKKLSEGVDEAWAVFDKDEHPAHKEAFEEAEKIIDGKKVYIAFSSRSFEYYLLLHFEYLYYNFQATECGERIDGKKVPCRCMTEYASEKACQGEQCINGYARMMNYWKETKTSESTFPLVENRLRAGIINAHKLRIDSDALDTSPIYERNPYTNVDRLICRLINTKVLNAGAECLFTDAGNQLYIRVCRNAIVICNKSDRTVILPDGFLKKYDWKTNEFTNLSGRLLLYPQEGSFCILNFNDSEVAFIERTATRPEYLFLPDYNAYY
ncbi:RloB family protein [Bacteroides sp.]|jgi:hypothetical protein|uniref:RloB family protein n=1 Tax=Bacteroides sp. TaxID=29523 RepID=UPI00262832D3|nr:RloB family protein [Bacteroides sp.]MDD3038060.1 RloB family protein [Bacteroides sp.]